MKNKVIIFCVFVLTLFSLIGCSNDKISKIEIIDDTIKTEYIVGEDIEIKEFKLKLTYGNKKEKIYNIKEDMITISEFDNTLKGKQKVDINIDYNGLEIKLSLGVEFSLPDKVSSIITLINELPDPENISFSNENEISLIENNIITLNDFYIGYIENYDKFDDCKEKIAELYLQHITTEFINNRFILKTNLDNYYYSLNKTDYSEDDWEKIINIYDSSIANLYLNENYEIIKEIVNGAKIQISKIKTIDQINAITLRSDRVKEIVNYRNTLLSVNYSTKNWLLLDDIEREYIDKLNKADSCNLVDALYNEAIVKFGEVDTVEDEQRETFKLLIEKKIEEVKNIRLNIDLNNYSNANRNLIANYYNLCLENIRLSDSIEQIDSEMIKFTNRISLIKTIYEEEVQLLVNAKNKTIDEINGFYSRIDIYKYDSRNKNLIQNIVDNALSQIENAETIVDINKIKTLTFEEIEAIPTMEEQAIMNLPIIIGNAKNELNLYLAQLDSNKYSIQNWTLIYEIVSKVNEKLDNEVTISTANKTIEQIIENAKNEIDSITTIEEEKQIHLNNVKINAKTELDEYLSTLSQQDFLDLNTFEIAQKRINETKYIIDTLLDEITINKLTQDTITAIEDAKI